MALYLPRWATDCLRRADPALAGSGRPLVLWERLHNAMQVVAVDEAAAACGLFEGQTLSDARAQVPTLLAREIDRPFLIQRFADFADWHSYASPLVSVMTDRNGFGDLVIDITGVAHLFGGEEKMLAAVLGKLRPRGFSVQGAVADSVGAAWALAHYAPGRIIAGDETAQALRDLPVGALRLDEETVQGLLRMGLGTIGQLYARERKPLRARFGQALMERFDQALGQVEERIVPRLPVADCCAERRFAEPIGLIDDVLMTAYDLAVRLASDLESRGEGAQTFHLFLYRVDHEVITLSANAARATRDPSHISSLFAHRAERLAGEYDAGFGIDMIRLAATSLSEVASTQVGAFETRDGAADLDRLYDRMTSRLGPLALVRSSFVNTHIPERAVRLEPVVARTPDDPEARPDPDLARPLRLLATPEPISVAMAEVPDGPPPAMIWRHVTYRFHKVSGPERIGDEWWQPGHRLDLVLPPEPDTVVISRDEEKEEILRRPVGVRMPIPARDYFIAEDDGGRRFWLFREGLYGAEQAPCWYLHGFFA